jgi:hypothetical protein
MLMVAGAVNVAPLAGAVMLVTGAGFTTIPAASLSALSKLVPLP